MDSIFTPLIVFLVVVVVLFLVGREVVCWYWKVNDGLELLSAAATATTATTKAITDLRQALEETAHRELVLQAEAMGIAVDTQTPSSELFALVHDRLRRSRENRNVAESNARVDDATDLATDENYRTVLAMAKKAGVKVSGTPPLSELIAAIRTRQ